MSTVTSTEERVQATARAMFAALADEKPARLSRERLQGEVMEWAMADERLKVEMLRFVDVFPTLRSRSEIAAISAAAACNCGRASESPRSA